MTTGDYKNLSADDVAEEADIVVVSETETSKRGGAAIFPLMLGVLILILDVYLLARQSQVFFAPTLQSGIAQALAFASIIICVFLIVYALRYAGLAAGDGHRRPTSAFASAVVLPLVLGAVAVTSIIGGLELIRSSSERALSTSCVEYIERAQNIAKDNPKFRMPAGDLQELRCNINASLGR